MVTVFPLSAAPAALESCIRWCDREWGVESGLDATDWVAEFERIADHPVDEAFVALVGDAPVGMVWMLEHEGIETHRDLGPWVSNLIVDTAWRDRGVARALLDHVETYMAAGGDERAHLLTRTPAIYFARGWEVFDTAPLGDEQVFVMRKTLTASSTEEDQEPHEEARQRR